MQSLHEPGPRPEDADGRVSPGRYGGLGAQPGVRRLKYSHDAMVDVLVQNPGISQNELAAVFGYTPAWVSTVIASDAFQARLAVRREELIDPQIRLTLEERFRGLVTRSLEVLQEKLAQPTAQIPDNLLIKAAELGAKSLGLGVAPPPAPVTTNLDALAERLIALRERVVQGEVVEQLAVGRCISAGQCEESGE